ncbi:bicyclomycin/multidrug efflux system [Roseivivax sp. THAF40]|uniref:MFS transporter n=1 Tax=Roseivivax sp. THAF40 TaxID=2587858 RepID=UPI001267FE36|nr:MFS transporter [Roseivivax sp. THAF40]QFT48528.1 bicyclomycin/multidrug efflux system [Roseivivax sp. THAF40]
MNTHADLDKRRSWARLGLTLIVATTGDIGMWAVISVLPEVAAEFDVSRSAASLPYSATMLGFALGNLVIGRIVDRYGMALTLAFIGLGLACAYSAAALAGSILVLALVQFVIGFLTAGSFGPLIADVSQWFMKRRGIAVGVAASGNYLSGAFWPIALGWLGGDAGWRWDYGALAVASLVILVPMSVLFRTRVDAGALAVSEAQASARAGSTGLSPRQLQWALGIAGIGCCVAMSMPQVHIVALCVDLGFGPAVGKEMLSLMLLGGVASRLVSGVLADRLGGIPTLLIGSVLQCIALILYLPSGGLTSLYIVSLIFGLSQGGIIPSYAVIVREYLPAREAGARVGFVIMMTILGMAFGGWLSGAIYDATGSYALAFWNGILWNGLNIAIVVAILMRSRPRRAPLPA